MFAFGGDIDERNTTAVAFLCGVQFIPPTDSIVFFSLKSGWG